MTESFFYGLCLIGLLSVLRQPIVDLFWKYFGDSILAEDHIPGEFQCVMREGLPYVVPTSKLEKNHD